MSPLEKTRFLLDENIDVRLKKFLAEAGYLCSVVGKGTPDKKVFEEAKKKKAILLTNDKDFANTDYYRVDTSFGMVVFKVHPPTLANLEDAIGNLLLKKPLKSLYGETIILYPGSAEVET